MNLSRRVKGPARLLYRIGLRIRRLLPRQRSRSFGSSIGEGLPKIEKIYVINLDRQSDRWLEMQRELSHVVDASGSVLAKLTERFPAFDAMDFIDPPPPTEEVVPHYTLADQLFVEPQPRAMPNCVELDRPIRMTRPEVAVALSHIGVWRRIAAGQHSFSLVLEDDTLFQSGLARQLDQAWEEIGADRGSPSPFDVLYLSYGEAVHGAQKTFLSTNVFRPVRGLWFLSGYVLSREGARKLLGRLPCRGPVDLWMNHQFGALDVRATRRSVITQRWDTSSANSYSILPALTRIGVIDSEDAALFHARPSDRPVFAFGPEGSGLSSLAMALSMLGYRCCSDLRHLPEPEFGLLLSGRTGRVFDAYVNIGSLKGRAGQLRERYPGAKFIVTGEEYCCAGLDSVGATDGLEFAVVRPDETKKWQVLCEHVRCPPPVCSYPETSDLGQRRVIDREPRANAIRSARNSRCDKSPWVVVPSREWRGIHCLPEEHEPVASKAQVKLHDSFETIDERRWFLRDDTFAGNQALFRPSNVEVRPDVGAALSVRHEPLGVRSYSAGAISSCDRYLFGRFEAVIQASNVSGVVTGFFLHRDSPRQEIDIEIVGNRPDSLLVNVFYNPGDEGAKFDYGYRGAPSRIPLGFDASQSPHRFAIEWSPCEIRWLVDGQIIHERVNWDPTPIPQLPMTLHVNTWPSRSKKFAGRLNRRRLPATSLVRSVSVNEALADRLLNHSGPQLANGAGESAPASFTPPPPKKKVSFV